MKDENSNNVGVPVAIVVAGILISAGVYFGLQGIPNDNTGSVAGVQNQPTSTAQNTSPVPTEAPSIVAVSVDDDAVLGSADAPVTVIEFSDYECPYCNRSYTDMLPDLKKEFVDTGKVKLVFRDLPLYFHDPAATLEANAANCARAQGDDTTYYAYHDLIFENTTMNGGGVGENKLVELAEGLGLDGEQFQTCLDNEEFADEVANDLADATSAGANGTPTYFVGKSDPSGTIQGEMVVGAVPFSTIKGVIESYLE